MQNLSHIVFGNYILTVSLFAWTVAQVSKTAIHAVLDTWATVQANSETVRI